MKRIFSLVLAMLIFASALSIPVFAASGDSAGTCPYCGSPLVHKETNVFVYEKDKILCTNRNCKFNQTAGRLLLWSWGNSSGSSGSTSTPSRTNTATAPKKYYTSSGTSGGSSGSSYNTVNSGNTSYYSTINTSNHTLNYTTYNQTTNNYVNQTYNYTNYTYNYDYNYYTVNVDNSTHYVIDNVNYITVIYPTGDTITNIDGSTSNEYESVDIYFQLPNGQNSYNVSPSQVWGEYFVYNVTGCDKVLEDDGQTLGLWHLDGDLSDSSANAGQYTLSMSGTTFVDVEIGDYGQAISGMNTYFSLDGIAPESPYTLEFRVYFASDSDTVFFPLYDARVYAYDTGNPTILSPRVEFNRDRITLTSAIGGGSYSTLFSRYGLSNVPANQWNTVAICCDGSQYYFYLNGSLFSSAVLPRVDVLGEVTTVHGMGNGFYYAHRYFSPFSLYNIGLRVSSESVSVRTTYDEIRLSSGVLYNASYQPSLQPYDTNSVLLLPQNPAENDIAVMSNVPVNDYRIGGVRATYPVTGDVYIYLEDDIVKSVQQYQGSSWVAVDAQIYSGGEWKTLKNFNLKDVKSEELETQPLPAEPDNPTPPPSGCEHEYAITKEKAPTCTASGYMIYKCSLCGDTYTDTVKALGHDWQLIESTPSNSGDESSDESPGYALYRCSRCGVEYKDFGGSGPPAADDDDSGFWGWLKDIAGSIFGGILDVLESIVGGAIGLIVKLVDDLFAGIVHVIDSLFAALSEIADFGGGFKDFLGSFFGFLPSEIVLLLSLSISLGIILMIIKFFRG